MVQGTTPKHTFNLQIDTEDIKTAEVVYVQRGDVKVTKTNKDITIEGKTIVVNLSQEDTFQFQPFKPVQIQLRVLTKSGEVLASRIFTVSCDECLSNEVLK